MGTEQMFTHHTVDYPARERQSELLAPVRTHAERLLQPKPLIKLENRVDALDVDHIGFLNNDSMPRIMCEFKAILDHLISGGKFGLFTGAFLPPDDRWNLIREVSTRLVTGYVASVEVPDRNLRRDIIENEFAKVGIDVVQNIVSFITDADIRDIRTIQKICHRLTVEKDAGNALDIERVGGPEVAPHQDTAAGRTDRDPGDGAHGQENWPGRIEEEGSAQGTVPYSQ